MHSTKKEDMQNNLTRKARYKVRIKIYKNKTESYAIWLWTFTETCTIYSITKITVQIVNFCYGTFNHTFQNLFYLCQYD